MKTLKIFFIFLFSLNAHASAALAEKSFDVQVLLEGNVEKATVFRAQSKEVKGILILTPTIAGVSPLEKINAHFFAKNGYVVIVPLPYINQVDSLTPDLGVLDQEFDKPYRLAVKYIAETERVLGLRANLPVVVLGASQGGFRSLIIASLLSDRVKALWFATAGVDFPSIYAQSKVEKIATFRERNKKVLGIESDVDYENYLRSHLQNDPRNICSKIKVPFVQVIALKDDKVPTHNQELLSQTCPATETIRLNTGHIGGSLSTVTKNKRILKFFNEQLE